MIGCAECQQYPAEIDGCCSLCRSLRRLAVEARRVSSSLRGWVIDQTRVWTSLLQEEEQKWEKARLREEARLAEAAATAKAPSPVVPEPPGVEIAASSTPGPEKVEPGLENLPREGGVSPGHISSPSAEEEESVKIEEEENLPLPEKEVVSEPPAKKKDKKKKEKDRLEKTSETATPVKKAKKEKNHKRKRKSSSRSRKKPRRSTPRRARSSRSPRSRSRRSPRRGDQRPPEPRYPPAGWRGASGHHRYSNSGYRRDQEEDFERWGQNKGITKRKKQHEWRCNNGYYYR